jgi:hypothetical protein
MITVDFGARPIDPAVGHVWFESKAGLFQIWDGQSWKVLSTGVEETLDVEPSGLTKEENGTL